MSKNKCRKNDQMPKHEGAHCLPSSCFVLRASFVICFSTFVIFHSVSRPALPNPCLDYPSILSAATATSWWRWRRSRCWRFCCWSGRGGRGSIGGGGWCWRNPHRGDLAGDHGLAAADARLSTTTKQSATLVVLADKSRSMSVPDEVAGRTRWETVRARWEMPRRRFARWPKISRSKPIVSTPKPIRSK